MKQCREKCKKVELECRWEIEGITWPVGEGGQTDMK